jgi:hypothetical protein
LVVRVKQKGRVVTGSICVPMVGLTAESKAIAFENIYQHLKNKYSL